jgi:transposase
MSEADESETEAKLLLTAAAKASAVGRLRIEAVAEVLGGGSVALVAHDAEVPTQTLERWCSEYRSGGVDGLIASDANVALPRRYNDEMLARCAFDARAGLERTAFTALAAAYRGSSIAELSFHYRLDDGEALSWIRLLRKGGIEAISSAYHRHKLDHLPKEQALIGRRLLPSDYSARFLRHLMVRATGVISDRILALALAYEGRTPTQLSERLGLNIATVEGWLRLFFSGGFYGLAPAARFGRTPLIPGFGASKVEAIASATPNETYRHRLLVIAAAFRGVPWADIGTQFGHTTETISNYIRLFEQGGPEGLAFGDGVPTPPLRKDYDAVALRQLASASTDTSSANKLEAIARLYDGETMASAARFIRNTGSIAVYVDAFNREGHRFAEPFVAHLQAPLPPPKKLPALRSDLSPSEIATYCENAVQQSRRRLGAIRDLYAGMKQEDLFEKWDADFSTVRKWIAEVNDEGMRWFASGQSARWLREHCKAMLVSGMTAEEVSNETGIDLDLVLEVSGSSQVLDLVKKMPNDPGTIEEVHHATRSSFEPFASCAGVVSALLSGRTVDYVVSKWKLDQHELSRIVSAFISDGVGGLATNPVGRVFGPVVGRIHDVPHHDFEREGVRIGVGARIKNYIRLADRENFRALKVVARAAQGATMADILRDVRTDADHVKTWISQYNAGGSSSFISSERDPITKFTLRHSSPELSRLAKAVPNKILARNIRIIAAIARGATPAFASDLHQVTRAFVITCLKAYSEHGIAGLATLSRSIPEMKVVPSGATSAEKAIPIPREARLTRRTTHYSTSTEFNEPVDPPTPSRANSQRTSRVATRHAGDAMEVRSDIAPDIISIYLENLQNSFLRPRMAAIYDLVIGRAPEEVCETYSLNWYVLKKWVDRFNAEGMPFLSDRLSRRWVEARFKDLLEQGLEADVVSKITGIQSVAFDLKKIGPAASVVRGLLPHDTAKQEVRLAAKATSEPLRTYAKIINRLYDGTSGTDVMATFNLSRENLMTILSTFSSQGVKGIAADPLNFATSVDLSGVARPFGYDLNEEGAKVGIFNRINSYRHLADKRNRTALAAVSLAAQGAPIAHIVSNTAADAAEIRNWITRYNQGGATSFIDAKRDPINLSWVRETAFELVSLANKIPDRVLARDVRIVASVIDRLAPSAVADLYAVSHPFVLACVDGYRRHGIAGLALLHQTAFPEQRRVAAASQIETGPIVIEEDLVQVVHQKSPLLSVAVHLYSKAIPGLFREPGALIAMVSKTITFTDRDEALNRVPTALRDASAYGTPGLIMVGLDTNGSDFWTIEDTIGGDDAYSSKSFVRLVGQKLLEDALPAIQRTGEPWHLVPFFRPEIDPEIENRRHLAVLRDNRKFIQDESGEQVRLWANAQIDLSRIGKGWKLRADAFKSKGATKEIFDILNPAR